MKKLLMALGLLGTIGLAQAQSSVQIYGLLDESVVSQTGKGLNATNMNSVTTIPSNIGFKGREDIGSGNGIGFDLNTGINLNSGNVGSPTAGVGGTTAQNGYEPQLGTSTLFYRAANMSFDNAEIGTVKVGRQPTPQFVQSWTVDALSTASGGMGVAFSLVGAGPYGGNGSLTGNFAAPLNPDMNQSNINGVATNYANGVSYQTPRWYGLQTTAFLGVMNGSSTTAGGSSVNSQAQQQILVDYVNGNYTGSISYANVLDNVGHKQFSTVLAGLGYTLDKFTFKLDYYGAQFGQCSQVTAGGNCMNSAVSLSTTGTIVATSYAPIGSAYGDNFNAYAAGVSYMATPVLRLVAQYTSIKDQIIGANQIGLSSLYADYALSKRTSVYALGSLSANHGAANMGPIFGAPTRTPQNGQDITSVALGIRHTF
jgi:predicted porin